MTRRVSEASLPAFRLTVRDLEICQAVYECRALTSPQVERLFFPPLPGAQSRANPRCQRRLQLLYHHGYLARLEQPQRLSEGRKPFVYLLDRAGVNNGRSCPQINGLRCPLIIAVNVL